MLARPKTRRDCCTLLAFVVAAWQLLTPFVHGLHRHAELGPRQATRCGHTSFHDHAGDRAPDRDCPAPDPDDSHDCSICHAYVIARTGVLPVAIEFTPALNDRGPAPADLTPQRGSQHAITPRTSRGPPSSSARA